MTKRVFWGTIVALLLTTSAWAADNKQIAREAYREGSRLYDLTEYRGALEAFKKAYVHFEEPSLLFNIAQCHRYLGEKEQAITFYKNYLRKVPASANADEVKKLISQLEDALAQEKRASDAPPSGMLRPDGQPTKTKPAVKTTSTTGTKTIETTSGPETGPAPTPTVTTTEPTSTPGATAAVTAKPERSTSPILKKWWFWTAVGGGVAVIALSVGLGVGLSQGESPYPSFSNPTAPVFRF